MSPTIVLRRGRPYSPLGSPGGANIITTVLQVLVNRLDLGYSLLDAIAAPRASQRNQASGTGQAEQAFLDSAVGQELMLRYGQKLAVDPTTPEIGAATGLEFLGHGLVLAAAEPVRRGGAARSSSTTCCTTDPPPPPPLPGDQGKLRDQGIPWDQGILGDQGCAQKLHTMHPPPRSP